MRKCAGITQACWESLSEDRRILWKYFSRLVGAIGAFFVAKTGNIYIDGVIVIVTAAFLVIVIETQRSYTKLSPRLRKWSVRIAIGIGSWGLAIFGIAMFSNVAIGAAAASLSNQILPILNRHGNLVSIELLSFAFFLLFIFAAIRAFRQLNIEDLIYHLPRSGLKKLLVRKQPKATSFPMFAYMEFSALLVCLVYASSVAGIIKVMMQLFGV